MLVIALLPSFVTQKTQASPFAAVDTRLKPQNNTSSLENFIYASVLPSGAIATHPDKTFVSPYLANIATQALAKSCTASNRKIAKRYLTWYARNSVNGVVSEFTVSSGQTTPTNSQDSQDASAGTFLSAYAALVANSPKSRVRPSLHQAAIAAVYRIALLQDSGGLTWAKPSWKVKYLMDQVEVFWGLTEASAVFPKKSKIRNTARKLAVRLAIGVRTLWDPKVGMFAVAKHQDGSITSPTVSRTYPDVVSQFWVLSSPLASKEQARKLMMAIKPSFSTFFDPNSSWKVNDGSEPVGYWPLLSTVYTRAKMTNTAFTYRSSLFYAAQKSEYRWPYNISTAGLLLIPRTVFTKTSTHCSR